MKLNDWQIQEGRRLFNASGDSELASSDWRRWAKQHVSDLLDDLEEVSACATVPRQDYAVLVKRCEKAERRVEGLEEDSVALVEKVVELEADTASIVNLVDRLQTELTNLRDGIKHANAAYEIAPMKERLGELIDKAGA